MAGDILDVMQAVRRRTFDLVGHLSPAELERQVDPIMSPLVWDLAHIAAYEDLWLVHRFGGRARLRPPVRRPAPAAPRPRGALRRLRDAAHRARRDRDPRHGRRAGVPRRRPRA